MAQAEAAPQAQQGTIEPGLNIPPPESLLKKRATKKKLRKARAARQSAILKKRRAARKAIFKKAQKYDKEYRNAEKQLIFFRRQAKAAGNFYREPQPKVAFVIRIRGINGIHPKPRKILQLLRLRQINNGVFVRLTKATLNMLKRVEPFVTYGYPNVKTVRELVYKRGFLKIRGQRIPITDNDTVRSRLGRLGVTCIEDIVHEIATCGKHFREVNRALWPFKLPNPCGGWRDKGTHFVEGGDCGDRATLINELVHRMV